MWEGPPQNDAGEVSSTTTSKDPTMLSPHIVSALVAEREADLERRAELGRRRHVDPPTTARVTATPTHGRRTPVDRRRRRLRLV